MSGAETAVMHIRRAYIRMLCEDKAARASLEKAMGER